MFCEGKHETQFSATTVVRDFGYEGLNASDFDWVITVPAFWKSEGGEMMREAGYMVSSNSFILQMCNHHADRFCHMLVHM